MKKKELKEIVARYQLIIALNIIEDLAKKQWGKSLPAFNEEDIEQIAEVFSSMPCQVGLGDWLIDYCEEVKVVQITQEDAYEFTNAAYRDLIKFLRNPA